MEPKIVRRRITSWIKKEVRRARAEGVIFGLSGGLDSSVVAALLKEALGKRRTLALFLPCHSNPADLKDAKLVARQLGIKLRLVDLSRACDVLSGVLPEAGTLAKANLRPRLRMTVLYYFANKLNYLVCGTGNKSELMAGYFTKYGDGGADLLPLGDLLKKEVRLLAAELRIPSRIICKPPTAGLWPGQTDEGEMGILYNELDSALEQIEKKARKGAKTHIIKKVRRMVRCSEHKRQGPKICQMKPQFMGR